MINFDTETIVRIIAIVILVAIVSVFSGFMEPAFAISAGLIIGLIGRLGLFLFNRLNSSSDEETKEENN